MKDTILMAIDLAFEAGKWAGQVELEEHMDNEQFSKAALESVMTRKTAAPCDIPSEGRTVRYNLRSDKWRQGVRKSSVEYKNKSIEFIFNSLNL